jgi:predicted nucleotidyltransferase
MLVDPYNLAEVQWPDTPFDLMQSFLLVARRGSESHGTYVPSTDPNSIDDRDLMGVCVPPVAWTLGLRRWEGAESIKGVWDVVLYDFKKFIRLLCKQNPNVIGMFWLEREDYLYVSDEAQLLIENRDVFRCRDAAYASFAGYVQSQLHKMRTGAYQGYMGAKRKALVDTHGFDRKNAAHLIRLLHMGEEYQRTGMLFVRRTWDREMLIQIKTGNGGDWSLNRIQSYAEECFENMRRSANRSVLPKMINEDRVNDLVVKIMQRRVSDIVSGAHVSAGG